MGLRPKPRPQLPLNKLLRPEESSWSGSVSDPTPPTLQVSLPREPTLRAARGRGSPRQGGGLAEGSEGRPFSRGSCCRGEAVALGGGTPRCVAAAGTGRPSLGARDSLCRPGCGRVGVGPPCGGARLRGRRRVPASVPQRSEHRERGCPAARPVLPFPKHPRRGERSTQNQRLPGGSALPGYI